MSKTKHNYFVTSYVYNSMLSCCTLIIFKISLKKTHIFPYNEKEVMNLEPIFIFSLSFKSMSLRVEYLRNFAADVVENRKYSYLHLSPLESVRPTHFYSYQIASMRYQNSSAPSNQANKHRQYWLCASHIIVYNKLLTSYVKWHVA